MLARHETIFNGALPAHVHSEKTKSITTFLTDTAQKNIPLASEFRKEHTTFKETDNLISPLSKGFFMPLSPQIPADGGIPPLQYAV